MGVRFGVNFLTYAATLPAGATVVVDRPVSNVGGYTYPLRTWRSFNTSAGQKEVILNFTTAKTVRHVFIGTANFSSVTIDVADNVGMSGLVSHGAFTVNNDRRVNRRKAWLTIASPVSKAVLRLTPNTIVGGAAYFEIGVVACFDGITELVDNPGWPNAYVRRQAQTRVQFASGGEDVVDDGAAFLEITTQKDHFRRSGSTVQTQLFDVLDAGMAGPVCYFENISDTSAAYIVRRVNDVEFRERYAVFETSITWRECI